MATGDSKAFASILRDHFGRDNSRVHTGVELGVHRGKLSAELLREFPLLTLYMIDEWRDYPKDHAYRRSGDSLSQLTRDEQTAHMEAAKRGTEFASSRRQIIRISSLAAVTRIPCPRIAFVIVDADHTYEAVAADMAAWWPRIEPDGVLAVHDYGHRRFKGVKQAVDEFGQREKVKINVKGSCAWAVKPGAVWVETPPPPELAGIPMSGEGDDGLLGLPGPQDG